MIDNATLLRSIDRQRPGWSLEQPFYLDPAVYAAERELWMPRQWMLMAHASELPSKGSHIVRDLFGESIIIVRAGDDDFRAYFNVCTHRGSRICKEDGRSSLLVCPYHAWSFKLTGELQSRRDMPEGVNPVELGLHPVALHAADGLILCALPGAELPNPKPVMAALAPTLRRHGIGKARIAARKSYPTNANWKLVIENAFECYHCRNAHPEYASVNGHVQVTGMTDPGKAESWNQELAQWNASLDSSSAANVRVREAGDLLTMPHSVARQPIGNGRKTLSKDGAPVSKLMGEFTAYDGGETQMRLGRLSFINASNDYVTLIQIQPRGPQETEMVMTWLVADDANPDMPIEPVQWMWDVTTVQDKRIIEDNSAGVKSCAYRPGPYTPLEAATADFVGTYLAEMRALLAVNATEAASLA